MDETLGLRTFRYYLGIPFVLISLVTGTYTVARAISNTLVYIYNYVFWDLKTWDSVFESTALIEITWGLLFCCSVFICYLNIDHISNSVRNRTIQECYGEKD